MSAEDWISEEEALERYDDAPRSALLPESPRPLLTLIDLSAIFRAKWEAAAGHGRNTPSEWTCEAVQKAAHYSRSIVCLDVGRSFRYEIFAEYKGNRPPKDEALITQVRRVQEQLFAEGYALAGADGFEADDVIATLARQATFAGYDVEIASRDKDLMQLVRDGRVTQRDPISGKEYDAGCVLEKMGVMPYQVRDLLALMGDTSDNVPGCKGVGPKTAATLIGEHGDLDGIRAALDATEGGILGASEKITTKLREQWPTVMLSRDLVTLRYDAPVELAAVLRRGEPAPDPDPQVWSAGADEETPESEPDPRGVFVELGDRIPPQRIDSSYSAALFAAGMTDRQVRNLETDLVQKLSASVDATRRQPTEPRRPQSMKIGTVTHVEQPAKIILYGEGGVGKTTAACESPDPYLICCEEGVIEIDVPKADFDNNPDHPRLQPRTLEEVGFALDMLMTTDHDRKTLVIDGLGELEKLVQAKVLRENPKWASIGSPGFGTGEAAVLDAFRAFIAKLDELRLKRKMRLILTGHARLVRFKNPEGPEFDRWRIAVESHPKGDIAGFLHGWCDINAFCRFEVLTDEIKKRAISVDSGKRIMHTRRTNAYDAKCRFMGVPDTIKFGWDHLTQAIADGKSPVKIRAEIEELAARADEETRAAVLAWLPTAGNSMAALSKAVDNLRFKVEAQSAAS